MKKWATLLAGSACALSMLSAPSFAKDNKELVFMNWGPYINSEILEQFTDETGIKVIYSTYESNETLYAKLKTHNKGYDLAKLSCSHGSNLSSSKFKYRICSCDMPVAIS